MGDACPKAHLNISVQAEACKRRERESRTTRSRRRRLKSSAHGDEHSPFWKGLEMGHQMIWCASSWFLSSRFYIFLILWLKVSNSPRAGMSEDRSLYLLQLVPRILTQTCCSSTSYKLVRVGTSSNTVRGMVGWVTIPYCERSTYQAWRFHHTPGFIFLEQRRKCVLSPIHFISVVFVKPSDNLFDSWHHLALIKPIRISVKCLSLFSKGSPFSSFNFFSQTVF